MQGTIVYLIVCNYVNCEVASLGELESLIRTHDRDVRPSQT